MFNTGTPSLANAEMISTVLTAIKESTKIDSRAEITIEVNPTVAETGKLR